MRIYGSIHQCKMKYFKIRQRELDDVWKGFLFCSELVTAAYVSLYSKKYALGLRSVLPGYTNRSKWLACRHPHMIRLLVVTVILIIVELFHLYL